MKNGEEPNMKLASWRNKKDPTPVAKYIADLYDNAQLHTDLLHKKCLQPEKQGDTFERKGRVWEEP